MAELSMPPGGLTGLRGHVEMPGSKSISNRLLLINHLAGNPLSSIHGLSTAGDTLRMQSVLKGLVDKGSGGEVMIGDAGTVMRFVLPLLCITPGIHRMTGTERSHERPIGPLVDALRLLGAQIQYLGQEGCLPLHIEGGAPLKMPTGLDSLPINAGISSQFVSALLLLAPCIVGGLRLRLSTHIVSRPYLQLTFDLMQRWGARVYVISEQDIRIPQAEYQPPASVEVEPDWSSAAYWLAWTALMPQSELFIPRLKLFSLQADAVCVDAFAGLGVQTVEGEGGLILRNRPMDALLGANASKSLGRKAISINKKQDGDSAEMPASIVDFNGVDAPDLMPTALVLCALKNQSAMFTGLETLRVKESDRLEGVLQNLRAAGACIEEREEGLYWLMRGIPKASDQNRVIDVITRGDHRMAMAFSLMASQGYTVRPDRPEVVNKSYPGYWNELERLGMRWQP